MSVSIRDRRKFKKGKMINKYFFEGIFKFCIKNTRQRGKGNGDLQRYNFFNFFLVDFQVLYQEHETEREGKGGSVRSFFFQ
jgi:hypothetical protein